MKGCMALGVGFDDLDVNHAVHLFFCLIGLYHRAAEASQEGFDGRQQLLAPLPGLGGVGDDVKGLYLQQPGDGQQVILAWRRG